MEFLDGMFAAVDIAGNKEIAGTPATAKSTLNYARCMDCSNLHSGRGSGSDSQVQFLHPTNAKVFGQVASILRSAVRS